jgi:hypothetical protein
VDVGDDCGLVVIVQWNSATDGGQGRRRRRRLNQGRRGAGLLGEDGSRALLLLQESGGDKDLDTGGVVLLLHVGDGGDHGIEFLSELGSLGILVGIVDGHRRWCRGAQGDSADHLRCSRRRVGSRPLGFQRSGSKKKLGSDYHVGERRATEYWIALY